MGKHNFNISSVTAAGSTSTYGYDSDGLLTSAGDLSISRDSANGLPTGTQLAGISSTLTYNQFGEPTQDQTQLPGSASYTENYTRDDAGRIMTKQEISPSSSRTYAYNYDPAGRLANVTKDGAQYAAYTYDANGNRTSVTRGSGASAVVTYSTVDAQDRVTTSGDLDLTYDANGDLTKKKNRITGDETTFSFSTLGDLLGATMHADDHIDYILDGMGRRTGKKVNGNLTQGFLYAPSIGGPVAELAGNGDIISTFTYATHTNVPDLIKKNGNTFRVITDQLGSPRLVVNADTGAVAQELEYDEFGRVLSDSNPGFQPFGFAGGIYDSDTGLTHFGAREYEAGLGRWTASDPIGFNGGDSNLYGYVVNDPLDLVDASGESFTIPMSGGPNLFSHPTPGSECVALALQCGVDSAAAATGMTIGQCLGVGGVVPAGPGINAGSATLCYVTTPSGQHGWTFTPYVGRGAGESGGWLAGLEFSNAKCVNQLGGRFGHTEGGGSIEGVGVGGSASHSVSDDGPQITVVGGGAQSGGGGGVSGGVSNTKVFGVTGSCSCP